MSELYGTTYRDRARPEAITATKLLGQVMFLVAIALAFAALGTWIGRDLAVGTARLLSFGGFGMLMLSSFGFTPAIDTGETRSAFSSRKL